jgi:transposase
VHAAEQDRPDVHQAREDWKVFQQQADVTHLVFLDESSVNTAMTRRYGRAPGQERVVDKTPDPRRSQTTILSSMRMDATTVPCVIDGALNGEIFKGYVKELLAPTLIPGDIVILDNVNVHKVAGIIEEIEKAGAQVKFLPPYSPDFNPIELMWSKMKTTLRSLKIRTKEALDAAIVTALDAITPTDTQNWFHHDGYSTPKVKPH